MAVSLYAATSAQLNLACWAGLGYLGTSSNLEKGALGGKHHFLRLPILAYVLFCVGATPPYTAAQLLCTSPFYMVIMVDSQFFVYSGCIGLQEMASFPC